MSAAAASAHKPGNRIPELSPFGPGRELEGIPKPQTPVPGPAYGCVEWFKYVDRPGASPAAPETFTRRWLWPRGS
jgi:hypothetical protein